MRVYYLETNSLFNLKNSDIQRIPKGTTITSVFSLLEYLKNTEELSFKGKSQKLKVILGSNIIVDQKTPLEKTLECFKLSNKNGNYWEHFSKLLELILNCRNIQELETKIDSESETFQSINNVLDTFYSSFEALINNFRNLRQSMSKSDWKQAQDRYLYFLNLDKKEYINYLAEEGKVAHININLNRMGRENDRELYYSLENNYDSSLDVFFTLFAHYMNSKILFKPAHKQSDIIDFYHFSYIQSPTMRFVTNDKTIKNYCSELYKNMVISREEYISKMFDQNYSDDVSMK